MSEAYLAGLEIGAAADEGYVGDGVVGAAEGGKKRESDRREAAENADQD